MKKEIIDLSIKHLLLTRFTAFVVVDESETVSERGARRTAVQPVEIPDRWELGNMVLRSVAMAKLPQGLNQAETRMGQTELFHRASPGTSGLFNRVFRSKRSWTSEPPPRDDDFIDSDRKPVSKAQRAALEKAVAALAKALKNAGERLDAGDVPDAEPIELARQALLQALGTSGAAVGFDAGLQKFLRSKLVELIAAFSSGSLASSRTIFDRVHREFDKLVRQQNFWEKSV